MVDDGSDQAQTAPNGASTDNCVCKRCKWKAAYWKVKNENKKSKDELARKEKKLEALETANKKLKETIAESQKLQKLNAKQEARKLKIVAEQLKRRDKQEAEKEKREDKLQAQREERAHKLAMEELMTPEERAAKEDARAQRRQLAAQLVTTAGEMAVETHKNHTQNQKVQAQKEMQAATAARRQAQRNGASGSGQRQTTAKRPNATPKRPRAPPPPEEPGSD
jgi:hypothetical protein